MSVIVAYEQEYINLVKHFQIPEWFQQRLPSGWSNLWADFDKQVTVFAVESEEKRGVFLDVFCRYCLLHPAISHDHEKVIYILTYWHVKRMLPERCGSLSPVQLRMAFLYCLTMRESLEAYFKETSLAQLMHLGQETQMALIGIWRNIFLNCFSPLTLLGSAYPAGNEKIQHSLLQIQRQDWYPALFSLTMYIPFDADAIKLDIYKLWESPSVPLWCKGIIGLWLFAVPYFNASEKQRKKILRFLPDFCQAAMKQPQFMSPFLLQLFSETIMGALWRISYLGGNHAEEISCFGDFICFYMKRMFPDIRYHEVKRKNTKKRPIRIGYISRMFSKQAVSYYMVNRILQHDRKAFEVYTFSIGARDNPIAEMVKEHSTQFVPFAIPNGFSGLGNMAKAIRDCELDILIYPDIGMDIINYFLAGLQLAPVQCALVGHGTTTGLATIQYYISGDFEPAYGQLHYREKLICLPNLGAAQLEPEQPARWLSRRELNIPEEAVVFVSCANGIKHHPERDQLLIEILKQAPNVVIALKPFMNTQSIEQLFIHRLQDKARNAGVAERLIVLPPLPQSSDLLGLLAVSDVQLDTYPYGGWTTNMEALYMGLPIVTQEGRQARNRWGAAMLRAMGIEAGIARNEEEYITWAIRYAQNKDLREQIRRQITDQVKTVLFNGEKAQGAYEDLLKDIYKKHCFK